MSLGELLSASSPPSTDYEPRHSILAGVDWATVNQRVRHEQRNREVYTPPISLFRWWARRPHALIGELLDQAQRLDPAMTVSDPFSGGGTVVLESARRGIPVYGQDIHPWSVNGVAAALDGLDPDRIQRAAEKVLTHLEPVRKELYATVCPRHGESEIVHAFWVRKRNCDACKQELYLYPYSLLTVENRKQKVTHGYFGCLACGTVTRSNLTAKTHRCSGCHRRLAPADRALLADRTARCPNSACRHEVQVFDGGKPDWRLVLVQRHCGGDVHFDRPNEAEIAQAMTSAPTLPNALIESIPEGIEMAVVRRAGFRHWEDLYPPRQLRILLETAKAVEGLNESRPVQQRLLLAACGAAEMAGFASRWDRKYPKAFEAVANHRYAALSFACETNLLAERGRGTIRRRFAASVRAAKWSAKEVPGVVVRKRHADGRRLGVERGATLACGSSERQLPRRGTVGLVLTDPPYFDDVQYAELASLFLVWARALDLFPDEIEVEFRSEAVVNSKRGTDTLAYRDLLTRIFREARRSLRKNGLLVITFHNSDLRAWWALGQALHGAGFSVAAMAIAHSENESDHAKRGRRSFSRDLVLECVVQGAPAEPSVHGVGETEEEAELLAAGRAIAKPQKLDYEACRAAFLTGCGEITPVLIKPTTGLASVEKRDPKNA